MYPTHRGAILVYKTIELESAIEHFLTSLMSISSATLSFSLPLFSERKLYIHHSFHGSTMIANNLKKGTYRWKKNPMPGTPYADLKYWLEKLLNVEGPTL